MNKMQALNAFWNSFSLRAYDENTVPDDAPLPYITYEASSDDFGNKLARSGSLWYRDTGWGAITAKEQEIADFIGRGGRMVAYSGGALWICKGTPWASRMDDPNDGSVRRIILNVIIEFLD